jgi:hypothetical protein
MFVNFAAILAALPGGASGAAFRIANETRPPGSYLFNTLLPEQNRTSYHVETGNLTIRSTMAGLVGMDSPYPPGGVVTASTFLEQTAKIANEVGLTEAMLRQIQEFMVSLAISGQPTNEAAVNTVLNFLQKVIVQPHLDRFEWMRGQALVTGELNWEFNLKTLAVDYGVDATHFLTNRTGTASYGGSASAFWSDIRGLRTLLKNNVRAFITHGSVIDVIAANQSVNGVITAESFDDTRSIRTVTIRRLNTQLQFSQDVGDTVTLIGYNGEGEVLDPTTPDTPVVVPFFPSPAGKGKILAIGNNTQRGFRVGDGSTEDPNASVALGYTHIAPTVEGGGRPGRWANLFTPEHEPYTVRGRAVTNGLPVIENPDKIAVASTDMAP